MTTAPALTRRYPKGLPPEKWATYDRLFRPAPVQPVRRTTIRAVTDYTRKTT